MRDAFPRQQSAQLTTCAKTVKPGGTTMYEAFEDHARKEHPRVRRNGEPVTKYETLRASTLFRTEEAHDAACSQRTRTHRQIRARRETRSRELRERSEGRHPPPAHPSARAPQGRELNQP